MDNKKLIETFYQSFAAGDAEGMISCYADNIRFTDPVFGTLQGDEAKNMWGMLLKNPDIKITVSNMTADDETGSANWTAVYTFSRTGRKVINRVASRFEFSEGKIITHVDFFNIWKWAGQAMGLKGYLLGWTPLMRSKIQQQAVKLLINYNR